MCIFCERAASELAGELTPAQKREAEKCDKLREKRVRATVVTGFLGAGKTTFLNFVLKNVAHGQKIGVVQNEFGSVPIDDQLMAVERSDIETIVMPNGCLCCRVRGDLVDALRRLAQRSVGGDGFALEDGSLPLDNLIIECSGLSEVLPVAQTFFADPFVQAAFNLDGVVCVSDAANFEALEGGEASFESAGIAGEEVSELLREQLSVSDVCLLNKCDMVDGGKRDRIAARVRAINPAVMVVPCRHGKVNLKQVLKVDSFSLETALRLDAHFLRSPDGGQRSGICGTFGGLAASRAKPVPAALPEDVPGVHHRRHAHTAFGSIGLEVDDDIDLDALKAWLITLVEQHGSSLLRLKGVVRTRPRSSAASGGSSRRAIVQGVGGHIEIGDEVEVPLGAGAGKSQLVFIGKLDDELKSELQAGFLSTTLSAIASQNEGGTASVGGG